MRLKSYPKMKDSEVVRIGEIPEHWKKSKIKKISKRITKGTTPTTIQREFTDEGIKFVKAENLTEFNTINSSSCLHIDDKTNQIMNRSSLKENDVLVTIAGVIGRTATVNAKDLPANTNQAVSIISPIQEKLISNWVAYSIKSNYIQNYFDTIVVQTAQANLSLEDLGNSVILVPPINEQKTIISFLEHETKKIKRILTNNKKLIELLIEKKESLINYSLTNGLDSSVSKKKAGIKEVENIPQHWKIEKLKGISEIKEE